MNAKKRREEERRRTGEDAAGETVERSAEEEGWEK